MSKNFWVISDTHFNHEAILGFEHDGKKRGDDFDTAQEMDERIIDNWNRVVMPGDHVYHLGDVLFGLDKDEWMNRHWSRLHGKKRLIVGNHDNIKSLARGGWFSKIELWRQFREFGLVLTHVPIHESGLYNNRHGDKTDQKTFLNVHGHIHYQKSPTKHHKCVCVEQTNYAPVNLEDLRIIKA